VLQPRLARGVEARHARLGERPQRWADGAMFAGGAYGGYFGAAQGIIYLAILGLALPDDLQRVNALKNVVAGMVNCAAGIVFVVAAPHVDWGVVGLIAAGSILGGVVGARIGRRLPPAALRAVIVVVGVTAIVRLVG
jgi:uncharacterized membrane protein YfcA